VTETKLPDYVLHNRAHWDKQAPGYIPSAERHWAQPTPTWGIWGVPEADVRIIPDDIAGKSAIELGCGTGYVSSWLARQGAHVVGIDNSEQQLETARRMQKQYALEFPLLHGNAESVPYPDQSFDFAISEYGACLWADPMKWVAEAARLLRPGGRLHFLTNAFLLMLCAEEDETKPAPGRLLRPAFGVYRMEWPGDSGIEFHLAHGDWVRLLRASSFEIEDLIEVRPPEGSTTRYQFVTLDWARKWPTEEIWKVRKRG